MRGRESAQWRSRSQCEFRLLGLPGLLAPRAGSFVLPQLARSIMRLPRIQSIKYATSVQNLCRVTETVRYLLRWIFFLLRARSS